MEIHLADPGLLPFAEFEGYYWGGDEHFGDVEFELGALESKSEVVSDFKRDVKWLLARCSEYTAVNDSLFDELQLAEEVLKIVISSSSAANVEEHLQSKLFELFGESGFELMIEICQSVETLRRITIEEVKRTHMRSHNVGIEIEGMEKLSLNQRKKREKKEEKERLARGECGSESFVSSDWLQSAGFSSEYLEQERMLGLQGGNARSSHIDDDWMANLAPADSRQFYEQRGTVIVFLELLSTVEIFNL